jgi:hypothetical protein
MATLGPRRASGRASSEPFSDEQSSQQHQHYAGVRSANEPALDREEISVRLHADATRTYFFFAALPIPDNQTDCGEPVALSKIIRLPVSAVVSSTGLKVTETLQCLPGANVLSHCDFTVNTDGAALSI